MGDLLPCPFCEGKAATFKGSDQLSVACARCGGRGPSHIDRKENLVASWNDRAPLPSRAARDVLDERARQVNEEGFTAEHDDRHQRGELAFAAIAYLMALVNPNAAQSWWPSWSISYEWFKPGSMRRMLVKAAALIIAEIERRDRASAPLVFVPHDTEPRDG